MQPILFALLAILYHEIGHLLACAFLGVRVKGIGLSLKGPHIVREAGPPLKNLLVSLAGPAMNVILMYVGRGNFYCFAANFCFAVFNLLPFWGSDGEHAVRAWKQLRRI